MITAEPHNSQPGEDSKIEDYQVNSLGPKATSPSPGSSMWTTRRDGEVKLRMEEQGPGSEAPKTVHQLFQESVNKYSNLYALSSKKNGKWLGLERFHGVGILGFNSAEWFIADIGAILAGGFAVGIYTTNSPEACHYVAENCSANVIVVENHKQLQKILEIEHRLPHLKAIVQYGEEIKEQRPKLYSGSLVETLREVRPTAFLGVPRVWEKMEEKMKSVGMKASAIRRKVAAWAKGVGLQTNLKKMDGRLDEPVNFRLARQLVYRKVRKAIGLDRCTRCYTGAAPITRETLEFFLSLNIPVMELYGMSESSGPHTISLPHAFKLGSCGKVLSGCYTLIHKPDMDGIGEICFSGRHVFMGYLNMEDKTREAIDEDGWLHSGDLGKHDKDGFLFITGRIKELIITAGGENVPPVPIEDAVKNAVPIISNAMLVGDKAKFLSMLLTLKRVGSKATKVSEIISSKDNAIYTAIQKGISAVNEKAVSNAQKVQKWVLLEKDFSLFGGELGPTMKLKRPVVAQKYQEQIARFYTDTEKPSGEPSARP
ncbi:hypothetical protein EK904_006544 [Melospiza melodia maxima]|nr:hypothetical protein EK904_006544 [Melospiza melodia maxima]